MRNLYKIKKDLYVISNTEQIKFNDYITDGYVVCQWKDNSSLLGRKKVILSTDPKLIADGIQAIDDEFLEWFVKNPQCEEVDVKQGFADGTSYGYNFLDYKIIISKEEPINCPKCRTTDFKNCHSMHCFMRKEEPKFHVGQKVIVCNTLKTTITKIEDEKYYFLDEIGNVMWDEESSLEPIIEPKQETLEETAERNAMMKDWDFESSAGNGYYDYDYVEGFTEGAEWQAKQDKNKYSEEDMKLAFETGRNFQLTGEDNFSELINNLKSKV